MTILLLVLACACSFISGAPLRNRMVDMTHTFDENTHVWPTLLKYGVKFVFFNEDSTDPNKPWIQSEEICLSTHAGTHMDAPRHFIKTGKTVDQLDIGHFVETAAVVDISAKAAADPDATLAVDDLERWEKDNKCSLNGTIVLVNSGWGQKWGNKTAYYGTPDYNDVNKIHFPGISEEAAHWLVDRRQIIGVGIDTLSMDIAQAPDYPAHKILLGHGLFGLENVANMDKIPVHGATLSVFPMKVGGAGGAPTRIIATFPEESLPHHHTDVLSNI